MHKVVLLNPAAFIIHQFGGIRPAARALGVSPSSVHRWKNGRNRHGEDGLIPSAMHSTILSIARKKKMKIKPADLVQGGRISVKM